MLGQANKIAVAEVPALDRTNRGANDVSARRARTAREGDMSIHGQWSAGSEEDAVQAGVIDALNGGHWRPPTDFPDAYNLGFQDA
jgi:hypothetical protein